MEFIIYGWLVLVAWVLWRTTTALNRARLRRKIVGKRNGARRRLTVGHVIQEGIRVTQAVLCGLAGLNSFAVYELRSLVSTALLFVVVALVGVASEQSERNRTASLIEMNKDMKPEERLTEKELRALKLKVTANTEAVQENTAAVQENTEQKSGD